MRKGILALSSLLILAALIIVSGCSQNQSTAPDTSSAVLNQKATTTPGTIDVFIGYKGNRPDDVLNAEGASIKRGYNHLPIVFASIPENAINRLTKNPNILYVEKPVGREYCAEVLDWGVDRVDAEYVHAASGNKGAGINVAILDTGGDMDHPDITWAAGYSAVTGSYTEWEDKVGHGTHCAGIVSADDNEIGVIGVAPECNMYMVQVSNHRFIATDDIIAGIDWCVGTHNDADPNNDIQIMSMSFSGPASTTEEAALQTAFDKGILLFAAAGNASGPVAYPAAHDCVVAVSASTSTDAIATYSNFGPEIEVISPGSYIYSTYKRARYTTMSGTSMACPMAAGVAAVAWAAHPTYSRDQIRTLLHNTAEDIGLTSDQQGYGLTDAENACLGTTNGDN